MHEKIKSFLQKHWLLIALTICLIGTVVMGIRHLRAGLDVDIKHNKITITKTK